MSQKSGARLENVNGVEEAFGFAIDFRDDASADGFDAVAFERTLERDFLALGKFFVNLQNAAVAAYEKGLCENSAHDPGGIHPGGLRAACGKRRDRSGEGLLWRVVVM